MHLICGLAREYGYTVQLQITSEMHIIRLKEGWKEMAGGGGYDIDEAVENCFLDIIDLKNVLGTDSKRITFENEDELEINLTLMGQNFTGDTVTLNPVDFDKWEF